jgi:uncharacterized protein (TIGR01319 family)
MRYNASTILHAVGEEHFRRELGDSNLNVEDAVGELSHFTDRLPNSSKEWGLDTELARTAAQLAMERHAGIIEPTYGPQGQILIQYGKDLTGTKKVIGTGGPLVFSPAPEKILEAILFSETNPFSLKPKRPDFYLDQEYLLYAIGLMSEVEPEKALRVAKKHLLRI